MLPEDRLELGPGDCVLLFTDGITEAFQETDGPQERYEERMYGDERLKNTFRSLGHLSPVEIRAGVLASLEGFATKDDVTLVIIKKIT